MFRRDTGLRIGWAMRRENGAPLSVAVIVAGRHALFECENLPLAGFWPIETVSRLRDCPYSLRMRAGPVGKELNIKDHCHDPL